MNNQPARKRLETIDMLRGLVIIIMALDHTRSILFPINFAPENFMAGGGALFMTRWITHICAPVFVFLSGTSIYLMLQAGKSKADVSSFLIKRGLWLILLEITVVSLAWGYAVPWGISLQVIWAIGVGMILMSGILYLPYRWILGLSILFIAGHNLLDGIPSDAWGGLMGALFSYLYLMSSDPNVFFVYPILPWLGVMMLGFCGGKLFDLDQPTRIRILVKIGAALMIGFIALRYSNLYGDPNIWKGYDTLSNTFFSFINVTKYGPSLLFLMLTLSMAAFILAAFERTRIWGAQVMITFGRVPLFVYLLHLYLIQVFSIIIGVWQGYPLSEMMKAPYMRGPDAFEGGLVTTYIVWIILCFLLYPLCKRYAQVKAQSSSKILAYL